MPSKKHAQDGRGIGRPPEELRSVSSPVVTRIRALCAFIVKSAALAFVVLVTGAAGQDQQSKLLVDCNRSELIDAAGPELKALEFDDNQAPLKELLEELSEKHKQMVDAFVNVSMAEAARVMRFSSATLGWVENRAAFRYVLQGRARTESRRPADSFPSAGPFLPMLDDLADADDGPVRFKYVGRMNEMGHPARVIAFLTEDSARQGLVWLDEKSKRVMRLRVEFLKFSPSAPYQALTKDVRFLAVDFPALHSTPWLPFYAVVHGKLADGEVHATFRFSDYKSDGYEQDATGQPPHYAEVGKDAFELLLDGVAAMQGGKPADAIAPLRAAMAGFSPERPDAGYWLAEALQRTGDSASAEGLIRDVVAKLPQFAPAHNALGAMLVNRGEVRGGVAELQEAAKFDPTDALIQTNLQNAHKRLAKGDAAVPDPPTFKTDVRQVLVPVVVTDSEGHHVTGLKKSDFKIFEDGVEQTVSSFGSERADLPNAAVNAAAPETTTAASADDPKTITGPHAYIICVDGFHTSFSNFAALSAALKKLFEEEKPGSSQYAIVSLGRSMLPVQNTTKDPAKVLETLGSAAFRKTILESQESNENHEMEQFERWVQEAYQACASHDPSCPGLKSGLSPMARQIAERSQVMLRQFLFEFRSVVEQVAAGKGRRTLILISDGFSMTPSRPPFELLSSYFPEFSMLQGLDSQHADLDPIFRLAAKGNVPIYTVDSRGLYVSSNFDASSGGVVGAVAPSVMLAKDGWATQRGMTLTEIASATGGTAFRNSNDLLGGLRRAFADGREYYLLSYVPTNSAEDGKFRKIEVKVTRKKTNVTAKRGYWASSAAGSQ